MNLLQILFLLVAIVSQVSCDDDDSISGGKYYLPSCLSILNESYFLEEKLNISEHNFTFELDEKVIVGKAFNAVAFGLADSSLDNIIISKKNSNHEISIFKKVKNVTIEGSGKMRFAPSRRVGWYPQFKNDSVVFSLFLEDIIVRYEYNLSVLQKILNNYRFMNSSIMSISRLAVKIENYIGTWTYTDLFWMGKQALQKDRLIQNISRVIELSISSAMNKKLRTMPQEEILQLEEDCL